jgi:hypothetical protein
MFEDCTIFPILLLISLLESSICQLSLTFQSDSKFQPEISTPSESSPKCNWILVEKRILPAIYGGFEF